MPRDARSPRSQGERIAVNPRRDFRARQAARERGLPTRGQPDDVPPGLLPEQGASRRWDPKLITPYSLDEESLDPYRAALRVQVPPGKKPNRRARVRVYHRTERDDLCWAFTITRAAFERLTIEGLLDSDGATYPDGQPVVAQGGDPLLSASVRCGTCGTHSVECLQIEFFQDG